MHFTYVNPKGDLKQGDLIQITDELRQVLSEFHPHYAKKTDYSFLVVLTQSCDLVMRNGKCTSRYITLAAARPLETLFYRELEKHQRSSIEKDNMICSYKQRVWLEDFMSKLLNNNIPDYFYLAEDAEVGIHEPHVVFLALSVAIKSEHYDICQKARFGQLTDIFGAKLGWLVGHIYSRVATPDWVPTWIENQEDFDALVGQMLNKRVVWVSSTILEKLNAEQKKRRKELQDNKYKLPKEEIFELVVKYIEEEEKEERRESIAKFVVEQASKVLTEVSEERWKELEYNLVNNEELEKLIS